MSYYFALTVRAARVAPIPQSTPVPATGVKHTEAPLSLTYVSLTLTHAWRALYVGVDTWDRVADFIGNRLKAKTFLDTSGKFLENMLKKLMETIVAAGDISPPAAIPLQKGHLILPLIYGIHEVVEAVLIVS